MTDIIQTLTSSIDFLYIIMCNAATWLAIEVISFTRFKTYLSTWRKRLLATAVALGMGAIMIYGFKRPFEPMFYGFFIQYLSWDYFFKAIIERIRNIITGMGGRRRDG